ncbi:MAG: hypothetical protein ACR2P0_10810 [Acidimicrobiales bacterium]
MAQYAQADESTDVQDLPPEVLDALPDDIRQEILDGARDKIPTEVLEDLRPDLADQVPLGLVDAASTNPGLTAVIIVIALLSVAGAVYGAIKGFLKVAIVLGVIAAIAWYWFFNR